MTWDEIKAQRQATQAQSPAPAQKTPSGLTWDDIKASRVASTPKPQTKIATPVKQERIANPLETAPAQAMKWYVANGMPKTAHGGFASYDEAAKAFSDISDKYREQQGMEAPKSTVNTSLPQFAQSFQQGKYGKAALQFVGSTAGAAQSLLLNSLNNVNNLVKGQKAEWKPDMSYADYTREVTAGGTQGKDIIQEAYKVNPLLGATATAVGETFSDPLVVLPGGELNDIAKTRNVLGTAQYAKELQAGKKLIDLPANLPRTQTSAGLPDFFVGNNGAVTKDITKQPLALPAGPNTLKYEPSTLTPFKKATEVIPDSNRIIAAVEKSDPIYERAVQKYDDAIEQIHNYFGTNELRADEIPLIKSELGIDLEKITDEMQLAEEWHALPAAERYKRLDSYGLADTYYPELANKGVTTQVGVRTAKTRNPEPAPYILQREAPRTVTPAELNAIQGAGTTADVKRASAVVGDAPKFNTTDIVPDVLPDMSNKVVMDSAKPKGGVKKLFDSFYTAFVDKQHAIGQFSKKADSQTGVLASNSRNVGGTVDYIMKDALVDRSGKTIGKSLKEVVGQVPDAKQADFWNYMSLRHNIDRAAQGKNVIANYNAPMSAKAVAQIEAANPAFKTAGDDVVNWIDTFNREWGVNSGIMNSDIYDSLRQTYKSYFPTQREFNELEQIIPDGVTRQYVDSITPIRTATGSERDINNPIENIMNMVNRTVRTARYNAVGQDMVSALRKSPAALKQYAEIVPDTVATASRADNIVSVLENGKSVYVQINDRALLDALKNMPKNAKAIPVLSQGTGVFKALITQYNPLFAVRNIARDVPTAYVYGSELNPLKFTRDLAGAGKDIVTNSPRFQQYKALGGGGSNFFAAGAETAAKTLNKSDNIFKRAGHAIESFNNLTETAPRLAEFNRTLDKTGDVQKALDAANSVTVNFARGGTVTKALDKNGVAYLNAGVQGLDKFVRGFSSPRQAARTLTAAGISITTPTVALYFINKDNPHYQALDNRTKDNYYLIPNLSDKDENGNAKTFIKIPKSRELGVLFGALGERLLRVSGGEDAASAFKGYGTSLATNFAPTNPIENNIVSPATWNLATNKDFAGRTIVPQGMQTDNRSKYLQYDETTSEITKAIAEYANKAGVELSPKQMDYLIDAYSGVVGDFLLPATTKGQKALGVIGRQFTSDPVYSNQAIIDFYDNLDAAKRTASDKNIVGGIPSKDVTQEEKLSGALNKASTQMSELSKIASRALVGTITKDDKETLNEYGVDMTLTGDDLQKAIRTARIAIANEANALYKNPSEMKADMYRSDTIRKKVDTYKSLGLNDKAAYALYKSLDALEPIKGAAAVSDAQRIKVVTAQPYSTTQKARVIGSFFTTSDKQSILSKLSNVGNLISAYSSTNDTAFINMCVPSSFSEDKVEYELSASEKALYEKTFLDYYENKLKTYKQADALLGRTITPKAEQERLATIITEAKAKAKAAVIKGR